MIKTEPDEVDQPGLLRAALAKAKSTASASSTFPGPSPSNSTVFADLASLLSCSECHESLREPTTLACGHAVCIACATPPAPTIQLRAGLSRSSTGPLVSVAHAVRNSPTLTRSGSDGLSGAWLGFGDGPTPSPPALQNVPFDLPNMLSRSIESCGREECRKNGLNLTVGPKIDFTLQKVVGLVRAGGLGLDLTSSPDQKTPVSDDLDRIELDKSGFHSALECAVCFQLLTDPTTSPCGHTFCGVCLLRAHDHVAACPLCRAELPLGGRGGRPNLTLQGVLDAVFAVEMRERKCQLEEEATGQGVPIFVCTLSWVSNLSTRSSARQSLTPSLVLYCQPNLPTFIHIFEPRYRLMLRRVLDSPSRSFGMVLPARPPGGIHSYGTMLKVQSCRTLDDGRSIVETVGTWRFRVVDHSLLDGYTVGKVERVEDVSNELETELERQAVAGAGAGRAAELSTDELMETCLEFVANLRSGSAPWVVQRLNNTSKSAVGRSPWPGWCGWPEAAGGLADRHVLLVLRSWPNADRSSELLVLDGRGDAG